MIEVPTKRPRYTVIVDEELLKEIEDFRFENRYPSRSAATLELIRLGYRYFKTEKSKRQREKFPAGLICGKNEKAPAANLSFAAGALSFHFNIFYFFSDFRSIFFDPFFLS